MTMTDDKTYTPPPVSGYRELTQTEVDRMNRIKAIEAAVGQIWAEVYTSCEAGCAFRYALHAEGQFRDAFMNLVRAVAKPHDPYRAWLTPGGDS